jgi:cell division protease FtsH
MGPARRSLVMNDKEKLSTAYHEAGHTLVARLLSDADPIHKVTIIPRGRALGLTSSLPEQDRYSISKSYCLATIRMIMGGRAAEELVFSEFTSGASSDLKHATHLAHKMVCEWGMSTMGPITFGGDDEVFLGRDFARMRDFSEETASSVDREMHRICEEAYKDARDLLRKHEHILKALAEALVERETLEATEIDDIIRGTGGPDILPDRDHDKPPRKGGPVIVEAPEPVMASEPAEELPPPIPPGGPVPETA